MQLFKTNEGNSEHNVIFPLKTGFFLPTLTEHFINGST